MSCTLVFWTDIVHNSILFNTFIWLSCPGTTNFEGTSGFHNSNRNRITAKIFLLL